jgi:hypothetical protein
MLQQYEIADMAVTLRDVAAKLDTIDLDSVDFEDTDFVVERLTRSTNGGDIAEALAEEFPYSVADKLAKTAPDIAKQALQDAGEQDDPFDASDVRYALDRIREVSSQLADFGYTDVRDVESEARELGNEVVDLVAEIENLLQL